MRKKKWKRKELHEPIQVKAPRDWSVPTAEADWLKAYETAMVRRYQKLLLLFQEYKIDGSQWQLLAIALANEFVPGLKLTDAAPGAPTKWTPVTLANLRIAFDQTLADHPGWGVTDAANSLAKPKTSQWRDISPKSRNLAVVLRRNYYRANSMIVQRIVQKKKGGA